MDLCKQFGLTSNDIDKEVSDEHILEFYPLLKERDFQAEKWRLVAAHLGFLKADIEHLDESLTQLFWPCDHEELMIMNLYMLQEWKSNRTFNKKATYQVLLEALIRCKCPRSAKQICSKQIIAKAKIITRYKNISKMLCW